MSRVIEAKNISYTYNKGTGEEISALKNVNMYVDYGEIVAIIGPSGSGKSTLLQHFNGLLLPQEGEVLIDGVSITEYKNLKDVRRRVGLLFQNPEDQIFERYVGDEIAYALFNFGYSRDRARERVKEILNLIGYDFDFKNRPTKELSGGEKRLISFLSVIAYEPDVLVLDEPTVGVDIFYREKIEKLIKSWAIKGKSVVIVSHNMDEVFNICDRVYILKNGRVISHGEAKELLKNISQLMDCGLKPPGFIMLIRELEKKGIKVEHEVNTEEDMKNFLFDWISKRKRMN